MSVTTEPTSSVEGAKVVEGSDGLLLEIDGQIVPNYDATLSLFEEGDVVTGLVVRIDNDEVLVDIGYKSEGVIPSNELSIRKNVDPHDEVEMGEEVDALVLTKEDQDGRLIMSKKRARFEKAWRRIEAAAESGEPVEGTVIEVVKGGLIIDLGVRGFLPASLVDIRRVPNLDEYLGTKIECKVIELNRSRNNVVLSRRAVLEEERKEQRQEILDRLQPGLVVEGQISNIVDFGAFVDLNGIDGLIHISELSWSHVNHPSEILAIGDTVQVKVLDIDRDRQRISLGLKQTQEDPWQRVVDTYNVGDELEGTVTKVVTFGAFVEILDGVEGLVHISELAPHHVENPREIVSPGDDVKVKILEIDSERRRLSLSVKRVEGQILPPHARRRGRSRGGRGRPGRPAGARPERRRVRRGEAPAEAERRGREAEAGRRGRASRRRGRGRGRGRGREADASRRGRADDRRGAPRRGPQPAADGEDPRRGRRAAARPPSRRERSRTPAAEAAVAGPVRRADRRARRRASPRRWRRSSAWARRRCPPTRSCTSSTRPTRCATPSSTAGAPRSRPAASSTAPPIARARLRRPRRARVARGPAVAARRRAGRRLARGGRGARPAAAPPPSSRRRCCSRPGWRRVYDATIAVVADEARARRAGRRARPRGGRRARGAPALAGREGARARRSWCATTGASRTSSASCRSCSAD